MGMCGKHCYSVAAAATVGQEMEAHRQTMMEAFLASSFIKQIGEVWDMKSALGPHYAPHNRAACAPWWATTCATGCRW